MLEVINGGLILVVDSLSVHKLSVDFLAGPANPSFAVLKRLLERDDHALELLSLPARHFDSVTGTDGVCRIDGSLHLLAHCINGCFGRLRPALHLDDLLLVRLDSSACHDAILDSVGGCLVPRDPDLVSLNAECL